MSTTPPNLFSIEDAPSSGFEISDSPQTASPAPPKEGFLHSLSSDLYGMAKGLPQAALAVTPFGQIQEALPKVVQNVIGYTPTIDQIKSMAAADAARKQAGRSAAYRAIAPLGELAGVNVGGMEQAAAAGDPGAVLGHAAAVPTAMALTAGAAKLGAAVLPKTPIGIRTRAAQGFQAVESQIGDQGINHQPVLNTAYKAMEMNAKGFSLPKPVADFVEWAKSVQASRTPFRFADARDFYTALGESIPWDQYGGKGGRMYTQVMKMRGQLGEALKSTAEQNGVGEQYTKALKNYRTASNLTKGAKTVGSALTLGPLGKAVGLSGGDFLQYLTRTGVNMGSLNPPGVPPPPMPGMSSLDLENLTRGGNPVEQSAIRDALTRAAEKARGNQYGGTPEASVSDIMNTVRQQRPELFPGQASPLNPEQRAAELAQWGPEYQGTPQTTTSQGGAGANYSPEDLAALKKRLGIP